MLICIPTIGQDDLYEYTHRVRRTILEVLQDFRHVSIPLDYIFDVFPLIRPRQFSIASSSRHARSKPLVPSSETKPVNEEREGRSGTMMDLCVAIVSYKTRLKIPRRGLCTTWLATLEPLNEDSDGLSKIPTTLRVGIRKGAMRLPEPKEDAKPVPVICVGPGTGVAPMRAIIQERIARGEHGTQAYTFNRGYARVAYFRTDNVLYFGCRSAREDYYYSGEWEASAQAGKLSFSVAFSRDQVGVFNTLRIEY
jgi:sulfite reductase alpha subunit-like flavoprotein